MSEPEESNKAEFLAALRESGYKYSDEFLYKKVRDLEEQVNKLLQANKESTL